MAACLLVLPIAVYIALYIPWAVPWQPETTDSGPLPVLMCWHTDPTSGGVHERLACRPPPARR